MNPADWLLILLLLLAAAAAVAALIRGRHRTHGCSGCCASCAHATGACGAEASSPLGQTIVVSIGQASSASVTGSGPFRPVYCRTRSGCAGEPVPDVYLLDGAADAGVFTGTVIVCVRSQDRSIWMAASQDKPVSRERVEREIRLQKLPFPDQWEILPGSCNSNT